MALRGRRYSSRMVFHGHWLVCCALAIVGSILPPLPLWASPEIHRCAPTKKAPAKIAPPKFNKNPYLLVFEPPGVRTRSFQGPRMRRPPLLPARKDTSDAASTPPNPHEPGPAATDHGAESILTPDPLVPPISVARPPAAPAAPEPPVIERPDNALTPAKENDPDLKDAAIYFEVPIGKQGARATIPAPAASPPPAQAQPGSSATYRQKE